MRRKGHIAAARGRFSRIRQVAPTCTPSSTWFLGPSRVHKPNGISIASAIFARLPILTCRPSDRQTDIYVILRCGLIILQVFNADIVKRDESQALTVRVRPIGLSWCRWEPSGKVSVCMRSSVTLGVASSVANDVVMRMTS